MNALNGIVTKIFDVVLWPMELIGPKFALILVSGLFGVMGLFIFKFISWQDGIAKAKDQIKGHLIEIRLYQDNLLQVGKSIIMILFKNVKYLTLNFLPFLPLSIPFLFLASQVVTRYSFDPLPITAPEHTMAGEGTLVRVTMAEGQEDQVKGLRIKLPETLEATSRLFRFAGSGEAYACQEVVAVGSGIHEIEIVLADGTVQTKQVVTGEAEPPRLMQGLRTNEGSWFDVLLWPGEDAMDADSAVASIDFTYPDRDQGWLPGGPGGTFLTLILASIVFGIVALKPLGVQI